MKRLAMSILPNTRRPQWSTAAIAVVLITCLSMFWIVKVRAADTARVQLDVSKAGPREVEEQTEKGVLRDYAAAWKSMNTALEKNNTAALGDLWTGYARAGLIDTIGQQQHSGVNVRYVDRGHKLDAVFYSQEGSALELHDSAQLQRQVLDGNSVIASDDVTEHYIVVMTPTSDHWQVRVFQSVPNF